MKLILKSIVFSLFASMLFGCAVKAILLEENFENYQLDKPPAGWFFPSAGKWRISVAGSRVLEQADRKALNSAAIVKLGDQSNYTIQVELQIRHRGDAGVFAYWNSYTETIGFGPVIDTTEFR